ncbi:PREDICTED: bidirectional sugar transporter SWEET8-like [Camelina sativa]|uniref:Bidirectional sugar transporter SWEET n=1 Tax=Camelina sativa TaxID=90675 RepID=A0ABM0UH89_CAMSA|nr:PREDICTED: bidirectional sugar transporter SWEET8-like [Camelina sativa]
MVDAQQVRFIIGVIGNVISFGLFAAPAKTFWRIFKKKSVEEFSYVPYVATVMNCMLWVFYGLPVVHKDSILVSTINGVGLVIELFYVGIYLLYCGHKKNARRNIVSFLALEVVAVAGIVLVTLFAIKNEFAKQTFVGVICDVFNIAMYGAPSLAIAKVVKTKSVEYMPFLLSLVCFVNAAIWTSYSLIYKIDIYVLASNGMGTLLALSQLIVYFMYYKSTPKEKKPSEVEISASGTDRV